MKESQTPQTGEGASGKPPRREASHLYRLSRLAAVRNIVIAALIAAGAVLAVLAVMAQLHPASSQAVPDSNPEGVLGDDNSAYFYVPPGQEPGLLSKPALYVETPFKYACGHEGSFRPLDFGMRGETEPQKCLDELQASICYQCKKKLKYEQDKKKAMSGGH